MGTTLCLSPCPTRPAEKRPGVFDGVVMRESNFLGIVGPSSGIQGPHRRRTPETTFRSHVRAYRLTTRLGDDCHALVRALIAGRTGRGTLTRRDGAAPV